MTWKVEQENGFYLPEIGWRLDARKPAERVFVSHAHFDHLGDHRTILCTPATAKLIETRLPGERKWITVDYRQPFEIESGVQATLYPAGHIVGSAMILLEKEGERFLYTGDFKLSPGLSAEPCEPPQADVVLMETTYGIPRYTFPPAHEVAQDIVRFCRESIGNGEVPVLFGYSLGKSQEILKSLSDSGLEISLHPQSLKLTQACESLGIAFPPYNPFKADAVHGKVVISPPLSNRSSWLKRIENRKTAIISGWAIDPSAIFRYQCDKAFPLSDHADYPGLLDFVERVRPKIALTTHGFADEFARTLRERGIDAWAIGRDNQLALAMDLPSTAIDFKSLQAAATASFDNLSADAWQRFAEAGEAIRKTDSRNLKIERLAEFFATLDVEATATAALFFTGRVFPQSSSRKLNLGWAQIKQAALRAAQASEADLKKVYREVRDGQEAIAILLAVKKIEPTWRLARVRTLLDVISEAVSPMARLELLVEAFGKLSPLEAKYLMKTVSGDLRIGLKEGLVETALARRFEVPADSIRDANLKCGDIARVARGAANQTLDRIELQVFHPVRFMLASPEPSGESIVARLGEEVWIEDKYDGIRCQIHKADDRVEIYSRELNAIGLQFPEIVESIRSVPKNFIADGELIAWQNERALPFSELQRRLGRKGDDLFLGEEVPIIAWLYDLIWFNDQSLLESPLRRRRYFLETLPQNEKVRTAPVSSVRGAKSIETAFASSRARGNEGLMIKDPDSRYSPGRRGLAWLKLKKAYATIDVVVVAVEYGHGKRKDVLSDYTFAVQDSDPSNLKVIGKAYTGLTDTEIETLTERFLEQTIEDQGSKRLVTPEVILEIAFDSIQPSSRHDSGLSLRFPRIKRIRTDKRLEEIDTLEQCRRLSDAATIARSA